MATRYYIHANNPQGFEEITKEEFDLLIGADPERTCASKVYKGTITIEEVPAELQELVKSMVNAKIEKWGLYSERNIPDSQALNIITGEA